MTKSMHDARLDFRRGKTHNISENEHRLRDENVMGNNTHTVNGLLVASSLETLLTALVLDHWMW